MNGPGKYDDLCTHVREQSDAEGVVLLIVGGNQGEGFSVQGTMGVLLSLPGALRAAADAIEADLLRGMGDAIARAK